MMKKLLVLVLALAITSAAFGTITTWVDPTNTAVTWSLDTVAATLTANSTTAGAYYSVYVTAASGAMTPTAGTDSGTNGVYCAAGDLAGIAVSAPWYIPSSDATGDPDPGMEQVAGLWFSFDLTGDAEDYVSLSFYDAAAAMHTEVLSGTIVPEPATMLLLGLGGLFLRRRK